MKKAGLAHDKGLQLTQKGDGGAPAIIHHTIAANIIGSDVDSE
jgi:hypothetical protein